MLLDLPSIALALWDCVQYFLVGLCVPIRSRFLLTGASCLLLDVLFCSLVVFVVVPAGLIFGCALMRPLLHPVSIIWPIRPVSFPHFALYWWMLKPPIAIGAQHSASVWCLLHRKPVRGGAVLSSCRTYPAPRNAHIPYINWWTPPCTSCLVRWNDH